MEPDVEDDTIDESNYQDVARKALKKYSDEGMLVDCLFWGHICGLYEKDIKKLVDETKKMEDEMNDLQCRIDDPSPPDNDWRD